ncbi:M23 family metallopeptidase [Nocardioides zeae]|uniref:M23 family metallopeptidase n=1 Tax=Nocardioides imazamoxiresistens TaxID=3231893 RepID=A0ABU3PQR4_9ACTN|nr:M23 family metallopeptidase [Nocardioides zeae]MDT9591565.1 M23 family metallopeptidase [Nocardioides zeae]
MRSFTAPLRRRFVAGAAVLVMALGAAASPLAYADDDDDDLRDQQNALEGQIDSATADLTESSDALAQATATLRASTAQLAGAQAALTSARAELGQAQAYDTEMQGRLDVAEAELTAAEAELVTGQEGVRDQRQVVADQIVAQSQGPSRDLEALGAVLGADDLSDLTRAETARTTVVGTEAQAYDSLRASEVMLAVQEQRVEAARDLVAAERQEAAENLVVMQTLESEAAAAEAEVASLVASHQEAEQAASSARSADQAELSALQAEERQVANELARRAEAARQRAAAEEAARQREAERGNGGGSGSGGGGGGGGGGGAGSSSGLSYPVNGRVTSPYGYRVHPIYGYYSLHDGVDFGASCGTPMYAAADGEVVSRYYTSVWGNRLIIDNGAIRGDGVSTIYNHASRYVVSAGQRVSRGQLVGYVGTTGWSTGCHLHFTVYKNGSPTNPMNYF